MNEIEMLIQTFKLRWKYHNLSILIGTGFMFLCVLLIGLTLYTMAMYNGESKFLCIGLELLMALIARQLYKNITSSIEDHIKYLHEEKQLKINVAIHVTKLMTDALSIKKNRNQNNQS